MLSESRKADDSAKEILHYYENKTINFIGLRIKSTIDVL